MDDLWLQSNSRSLGNTYTLQSIQAVLPRSAQSWYELKCKLLWKQGHQCVIKCVIMCPGMHQNTLKGVPKCAMRGWIPKSMGDPAWITFETYIKIHHWYIQGQPLNVSAVPKCGSECVDVVSWRKLTNKYSRYLASMCYTWETNSMVSPQVYYVGESQNGWFIVWSAS